MRCSAGPSCQPGRAADRRSGHHGPRAGPGQEGVQVTFTDGRTDRVPHSSIAEFGTELGNPGNWRNVRALTAGGSDAPSWLAEYEIVDTPGTGSVHAHNTKAADAALPSMDAAIFVLTSDPPVSASERDMLRRVADLSVALFVVPNKADYLDPAGRARSGGRSSRRA